MHSGHGDKNTFWRSPLGLGLSVFLVIGGVLLVFEHRAHIFGASPLLLLLGVCIGMHFLMHRGHGSHGDDDDRQADHGKESGDGR